MDVFYAVTAESFSSLDLKYGQFFTTKLQYFMIVRQLGYVKYTFRHFIGAFNIKGSKTIICFLHENWSLPPI